MYALQRYLLCQGHSVCVEWTEEKWRKWDASINSAARKKAKRASLAQQKALAAAGETGRGLAPATPAISPETALGPKPRPVSSPAAAGLPVQLSVVPATRHPPVPVPALGVQSRPVSTSYKIPRRLPQVPALAATRVILTGRGPATYSQGRRSPSPKARDRRHREEDMGRMPPPRTPYDDRGRSSRDREARERDRSMGPDRDWSPRHSSGERSTGRPKPSSKRQEQYRSPRSSSRESQDSSASGQRRCSPSTREIQERLERHIAQQESKVQSLISATVQAEMSEFKSLLATVAQQSQQMSGAMPSTPAPSSPFPQGKQREKA